MTRYYKIRYPELYATLQAQERTGVRTILSKVTIPSIQRQLHNRAAGSALISGLIIWDRTDSIALTAITKAYNEMYKYTPASPPKFMYTVRIS